MAKSEKITDDLTHEEITYPFISARSIRVELSPTEFAWMGTGDVMVFGSGENLGKWAEAKFQEVVDNPEEEEDY